jgi:Tfp pilus assembly protein PilF
LVFRRQGQFDKALKGYRRALDRYEESLGKDHPYTLTTVNCMASVFDSQGQHDMALEWYRRALDGREKALGKDHPDTHHCPQYGLSI